MHFDSDTCGITVPDGAVELFVPGRVCLMGEHSDWAGESPHSLFNGECLVYNTDVGLHAWAWQTHEEPRFKYIQRTAEKNTSFASDFMSEKLSERALDPDEFFAYVCGTASVMIEHFLSCNDTKPKCGITIYNDASSIPMGKGFSSSAAICVLVVRAFIEVFSLKQYRGSPINDEIIMDMACAGEWKTGSRCGRMDQCVAFGPKQVVSMAFGNSFGKTPAVTHLTPGCEFHFVVADLKASKDTRKILNDLRRAFGHEPESAKQVGYVSDAFPINLEVVSGWPVEAQSLLKHLSETVNPENSVKKFLGEENAATLSVAKAALIQGNKELLGALLTLSQYRFNSCLVPKCPELVAPKLHGILTRVQRLPSKLSLGGKGVGSQGDGSVQFLCPSASAQRELAAYLADCENLNAFTFSI